MYKIRNNLCPTYLNQLLTPANNRYGSINYILPFPRIDLYKTSFSFSGPQIWNSLPPHVKNSKSFACFKNNLLTHLES